MDCYESIKWNIKGGWFPFAQAGVCVCVLGWNWGQQVQCLGAGHRATSVTLQHCSTARTRHYLKYLMHVDKKILSFFLWCILCVSRSLGSWQCGTVGRTTSWVIRQWQWRRGGGAVCAAGRLALDWLCWLVLVLVVASSAQLSATSCQLPASSWPATLVHHGQDNGLL